MPGFTGGFHDGWTELVTVIGGGSITETGFVLGGELAITLPGIAITETGTVTPGTSNFGVLGVGITEVGTVIGGTPRLNEYIDILSAAVRRGFVRSGQATGRWYGRIFQR